MVTNPTHPLSDSDEKQKLLNIARRVITLEADAVLKLANLLDDHFINAIEMIYRCQGRVIITGLGKSGAIGRKIAATLASTGTASYFLHPSDGVHGDIGIVHKDDVVICLSKSGESDELSNLMPIFKRIGVPIISITANHQSQMARYSDIVLTIAPVVEACPHDLAPTTSTTAMLALGDALAIALLEKRHFSKEDFAFLHPAGALGKRLLLRVDDVMESGDRLPTVSVASRMKAVVLEMTARRGICMVVDGQGKVLGIVTNGDLIRLVEKTEHFFDIPVIDVMNANPKTVNSDTLAYTAYKKMEQHRIIAMPVLDKNGVLAGVIHLHDIMRAGIF